MLLVLNFQILSQNGLFPPIINLTEFFMKYFIKSGLTIKYPLINASVEFKKFNQVLIHFNQIKDSF